MEEIHPSNDCLLPHECLFGGLTQRRHVKKLQLTTAAFQNCTTHHGVQQCEVLEKGHTFCLP